MLVRLPVGSLEIGRTFAKASAISASDTDIKCSSPRAMDSKPVPVAMAPKSGVSGIVSLSH